MKSILSLVLILSMPVAILMAADSSAKKPNVLFSGLDDLSFAPIATRQEIEK